MGEGGERMIGRAVQSWRRATSLVTLCLSVCCHFGILIVRASSWGCSTIGSPQVLVGGGYAGSLATWSKMQYPALFAAAWASSAPLEAVRDFSEWDAYLAQVVGGTCSQALRMAGLSANGVMMHGNEGDAAALRAAFGAPALGLRR